MYINNNESEHSNGLGFWQMLVQAGIKAIQASEAGKPYREAAACVAMLQNFGTKADWVKYRVANPVGFTSYLTEAKLTKDASDAWDKCKLMYPDILPTDTPIPVSVGPGMLEWSIAKKAEATKTETASTPAAETVTEPAPQKPDTIKTVVGLIGLLLMMKGF